MQKQTLSFKKLPSDVQTRLIELQSTSPDRFVFLTKPSALNYLAVAAGIGWLAYMFVATSDYLWEPWMFWIFFALSMILVPLGLWSAWNLVSAFSGKTKNGYVFTADECISYRGDRIGFRSLAELESFQLLEHIKTIEVWIGDEVEKIKAHDFAEAMRLDATFLELRKSAGDSFLKAYLSDATAFDPKPRTILSAVLIAVFLVIAAATSFLAGRMNRNHDDEQSWKRTGNGQTVADYAAYRERHPNGRYAAEAEQKIVEIIRKAKDDFAANAKASANPAAVAALTQVLDEAATGNDRRIYVKFNEVRQLDEEIVKVLKKNTGLDINSYDFTIPASAIQFRKDKVLNDISVLFLPATRNASLEFVLADEVPAGAPVVEVTSVMKSIEFYYFFNWFSGNGSMTRYYNPGVKFEFDVEMRPKDTAKTYKTQYISNFTQNLKPTAFDMRDAANYSFDKVYFGAVSEDLAKYLQREFGFIE